MISRFKTELLKTEFKWILFELYSSDPLLSTLALEDHLEENKGSDFGDIR